MSAAPCDLRSADALASACRTCGHLVSMHRYPDKVCSICDAVAHLDRVELPLRCSVCNEIVGTAVLTYDGEAEATLVADSDHHLDHHAEGCSIGAAIRRAATEHLSVALEDRCRVCGGSINWIDAPTGGWWQHAAHPADDHDAVLEMPR
jgi:hypothetical protein